MEQDQWRPITLAVMKILGKIVKWSALGLVSVVGLFLLGLFAMEPVVTGRLLGSMMGMRPGPQAVVTGGTQYAMPVANDAARTLEPGLIDAIVEWGAGKDSHAILVWHDGAIQLEHYYPGHGPASMSPTQSMHKSVLAMVVGIAIEEGHIGSVDDPASRWITEWGQDDDPRAAISLRQLLRQESGIDFPTMEFSPRSDYWGMFVGSDITSIVLKQPLAVTPGERFDYSGVGPQILGLVIERATGQPYAEYLSEALWKKLGMPDAYVLLDSEETGVARTLCCLDATARSWLALGLLHLDGGRIGGRQVVPAEWIAEIQAPGATNANYGYLTWLGNEYEPRRAYNSKSAATVAHSAPFAAPDVASISTASADSASTPFRHSGWSWCGRAHNCWNGTTRSFRTS